MKTQEELQTKLDALGELTYLERNRVTCVLIGHSRVVSMCFGYVECERCCDQIGDTLGGMADLSECVVIGHACDVCRENWEKLTWKDKLFVGNPFEEDDTL